MTSPTFGDVRVILEAPRLADKGMSLTAITEKTYTVSNLKHKLERI